MRILVLGAGVSGLSCAHELARAGHQVELWARERQQATTSTVAAAIWYPYHVEPQARVVGWALHSLRRFAELAEDRARGIRWHRGTELFPSGHAAPDWIRTLPGSRALETGRLPQGFAQGFEFDLPVIETPTYMPWLEGEVLKLGVQLRVRVIDSLRQALDHCPQVVNCTGLGSRALAHDSDLHPVRGQLVRVAQLGFDRFWFDEHRGEHPTYIIPREHDVVLGSSAERNEGERLTEPAMLRSIIERCARLEPELRDATVLGTSVGLRPARSAVRLEPESSPAGRIVHNYGHGGAGVTLSWGCAQEVAQHFA